MSFFKKYDQNEINRTFKWIEKNQYPFEIVVDGLRVVPKTTDYDKFNDYLEFIYPTTQVVQLKIYQDNSGRFTNMSYRLTEEMEQPKPDQALNGIPENAEELKKKLREEVRKEIESQKKSEELEGIIEDQAQEIAELRNQGSMIQQVLAQFATPENIPALAGTIIKVFKGEPLPALGGIPQNDPFQGFDADEKAQMVAFIEAAKTNKKLLILCSLPLFHQGETLDLIINQIAQSYEQQEN